MSTFNSLLSPKKRPAWALQTPTRLAATTSRRSPLPPKCPNHRRVFASWNWLGGKSIANGIHHLAAHRVARASQRIHRDPLGLQLCVLGPLRRLRAACRQKIAPRVRGTCPSASVGRCVSTPLFFIVRRICKSEGTAGEFIRFFLAWTLQVQDVIWQLFINSGMLQIAGIPTSYWPSE